MKTSFFFLLLSTCLTGFAQTDTVFVDDDFNSLEIKSTIKYFRTTDTLSADAAWKVFSQPGVSSVLDKVQLGPVNDFFWLAVTVKNSSSIPQDLYLQIRQVHIYRMVFHRVLADSVVPLYETGIHYKFDQRPVQDRFFDFPMELAPGESYTALLLVNHMNSLYLPFHLLTAEALHHYDYTTNIILGIWMGFISFCAVFALIAAVMLRTRLLIWYFLYLVTVAAYGAVEQGFGFQFLFPGQADLDAPAIIHLTVYVFIFLIRFSQGLLETKKYLPRVHVALDGVFYFMVFMIVFGILFSGLMFKLSTVALPVINLVTLLGLILLAYSGIKALRTNRVIAIFYLVAYGTLITASIHGILTSGFAVIQYSGVSVTLYAFFLEAMLLSVALVILYRKVQNDQIILRTQLASQEQQMYQKYIEGIEGERGRIAGELHDDIGSRLSHLKRNIQQTTNADTVPFDELIQNIRDLSHDLAPPTAHVTGLMPLVERLIADARRASGIDIKLQQFDYREITSPAAVQQIYRIIQEILHNITKHSGAHRADIQFFGYDDSLVIHAEDDGVGFDPTTASGFGLNQIKVRAAAVGGIVEINSSPGKGCSIILEVAVQRPNL